MRLLFSSENFCVFVFKFRVKISGAEFKIYGSGVLGFESSTTVRVPFCVLGFRG